MTATILSQFASARAAHRHNTNLFALITQTTPGNILTYPEIHGEQNFGHPYFLTPLRSEEAEWNFVRPAAAAVCL